jgi:competence protein ComEC
LISRFTAAEKAKKVAGPISAYLLFTLAAQLTTLPIMAYQFGRVSLISIIANPFILPAQPALMILAGLAMLLSFVFLPLGKLVGWIAWPFAAYSNRMVEFFNGFPHGVIVLGEFSLLFVILYYALLMAWTFSRPRVKGGLRSILTPTVIIATLGVSAFLVWTAAFTAPDGKLHLTFLDVGSADAVLIQTPSGRTVLVNGGESPSALADALGWRLSPFDRHLDWLVVAAPQEQQVAALPVIMDRYQIDNVLWSGNLDASYSARKVNQQITDKATPLTLAYEGASLDLGEGATLKTLAISPRGAVLLVEWKGFRTLLPLGMNLDTLTELDNGEKIGPVTTLLLADSGFAPLNPPEWIAALRPHLVIISVAAGDPQGLPAQTVLEQLTGTSILRTDWNGWIEITTDGDGMWVNVEKHNNIVLK